MLATTFASDKMLPVFSGELLVLIIISDKKIERNVVVGRYVQLDNLFYCHQGVWP